MQSKRNRIFDEFGGYGDTLPEFKIGHRWEYVHVSPHPSRPTYYRVFVKRRGVDEVCVAGGENRALLVPVIVDTLRELEILSAPTKHNKIRGHVLGRLGFWTTY